MTYRLFAYDILETLKQRVPTSPVKLVQVIYWIQVAANRLRAERIPKTKSGMYLTIFADQPVLLDNNFSPARKYIELPGMLYDLPDGRSVEYITYCDTDGSCCDGPAFAQVKFDWTTPGASQQLYMQPYTTPSPSNPFAYQVGDRIYFLGIECVDVPCVEPGLYLELNPKTVCNLDDEIMVDPGQLEFLRFQVLKAAQFPTMVPKDLVNDGANLQQPGPKIPEAQPQQEGGDQ